MRRNNQTTTLLAFIAGCILTMILSGTGALSNIESLAAAPFNAVSGLLTRASSAVTNQGIEGMTLSELRAYAIDLENTLARLQVEVVSLRERTSDYERLAGLLDYNTVNDEQEVIAADVISRDTTSALRTIVINRGTRDGVRRGMAVVTGEGMVGRVIDVSADAARVLLVTAEDSSISARLQTSREEGAVGGTAAGGMRMFMLPLDAVVEVGDLVITSGLAGNLPADLVIGTVTSVRQFESEIETNAEVRSFINFDQLEVVLVITSFEPIDLSVFEEPEDGEETAP